MVQFKAKHKSKSGGLSEAGRKYAKSQGMNLKRPVTGKVKPGSKAAKRRASFCARMGGMKKKLTGLRQQKTLIQGLIRLLENGNVN
jgi:uncharacterized protein YfiM (DUF2279 family)